MKPRKSWAAAGRCHRPCRGGRRRQFRSRPRRRVCRRRSNQPARSTAGFPPVITWAGFGLNIAVAVAEQNADRAVGAVVVVRAAAVRFTHWFRNQHVGFPVAVHVADGNRGTSATTTFVNRTCPAVNVPSPLLSEHFGRDASRAVRQHDQIGLAVSVGDLPRPSIPKLFCAGCNDGLEGAVTAIAEQDSKPRLAGRVMPLSTAISNLPSPLKSPVAIAARLCRQPQAQLELAGVVAGVQKNADRVRGR